MKAKHLVGLFLTVSIALVGCLTQANAGPSLVFDATSGAVLAQADATRPWFPASLTKLMTIYVALSAVRDGRVSMDTPFVVSARAASMPPSKMGFKPGTELTLNNALKMMMVKSANDLAIVIAEGLDGSVEDFAEEMNHTAQKLGMRNSHFVNPNGLPDPNHYSSARDMGIVARALFRDFPDDAPLYGIGAFQLGDLVVPTHNNLLGRYPGVDGMKTGYTCSAGFNVVVSAVRGGRRLIAVVLGSPNIKARTAKVVALLDAGFEGALPNGPQLEALPASSSARAPDLHPYVCGRHRLKVAGDDLPALGQGALVPGGLPPMAGQLALAGRPEFTPIPVFLGAKPGWTGPVREARAPVAPVSAFASQKADAGPLAADPAAVPLNAKTQITHSAARAKPHARKAKYRRASRGPRRGLSAKQTAGRNLHSTAAPEDDKKASAALPVRSLSAGAQGKGKANAQ